MKKQPPEPPYFLGRPFSPIYALVMKMRAGLYHRRVLTTHHFDVPVISVGNLTMGGTGKTPLVIYLADLLRSRGYRPAVISRGYKGLSSNEVNIVCDRISLPADPQQVGDEPYLIADRLRDVVVMTGKKRHLPCRAAIDNFGCNVLILDDGFQHLAVARSLDLVLFDVDHFAGNSRVFPGGELREPISALRRCDAFVLTGATLDNQQRADACTHLLTTRFAGKPVIQVSRRYARFVRHEMSSSGPRSSAVDLADIPRPLSCFCAIARPERLAASLAALDIEISTFTWFTDHYRISETELAALTEKAVASGAQGLLTTEKDMTKLKRLLPRTTLPIFVPILEIPENRQLNNLVLDVLKS
jgi:tetraacyldisaccharide 4'-kinase